MSPAVWIAELAPDYGASVATRDGGSLVVDLALPRVDGRVERYRLAIDARSADVKVREERPRILPSFCPERHINIGGWFCLTWRPAAPLTIRTFEDATNWWETVLAFLWLQERAARLRRWPQTHAWAHGNEAAAAQRDAEMAARALGPKYEQALAQRRLSVRRKPGAVFVELRDGDRWLYSAWQKERRVATLGQPCLCGNMKRQLRACGEHASAAATLVFSLLDWEAEEARFWKCMRGKPCCGSMNDCPLAATAKAA